MKYLISLFYTPYSAVVLAVLFVVLGLNAMSPPETHAYGHDEYRQDVTWCVDHNWWPKSEGPDLPVTCLDKDHHEVAVPPWSLTTRRSEK